MKKCFIVFVGIVIGLFSHYSMGMAVQGDTERGRAIYLKHCAICHGGEGKGRGTKRFDPPLRDLTSPDIQLKSDFELWKTVHSGRSHSSMKSWKWTLSEEEIVAVLAYVQSLGQ